MNTNDLDLVSHSSF